MTPLEIAKANLLKEKKTPPCKDCPKSERVNEVLYCSVTGKIIMPMHEHLCICQGKRLEERKE
jgi:hypothetical protein